MTPIAEWRLGTASSQVSPRAEVPKLPCPVFVIVGDQDLSTQPSDAREIFDAAREPKSWWLVSGAAHVDLYGFAQQTYERRLLEFISAHP